MVGKGKTNSKDLSRKALLERVIGFTGHFSSSFTRSSLSGDIAYPCGCVIALYNPTKNKQVRFLLSRNQKPIGALCFSHDGKFLAAGEVGKDPSIVVWNVSQGVVAGQMKGHVGGVQALAFSPSDKLLLSSGFSNDKFVYVWDWAKGAPISAAVSSKRVNSLCFVSEQAFVTVGAEFKYWSLDRKSTTGSTGLSLLKGSRARLGEMKGKEFVAVGVSSGECGLEPEVYALSSDGFLCRLSTMGCLLTFVDSILGKGTCLYVMPPTVATPLSHALLTSVQAEMGGLAAVYVGGGEGLVRAFSLPNLDYLGTLPLPLPRDAARPSVLQSEEGVEGAFPTVLALSPSFDCKRLCVFYANHCFVDWLLHYRDTHTQDPSMEATFFRAVYGHSAAVTGIHMLPIAIPLQPPTSPTPAPSHPPMAAVSCSEDGTARVWGFESPDPSTVRPSNFLKETLVHAEPLRSLAVDGPFMVVGDAVGNVRVYHRPTTEWETHSSITAHDGPVTMLSLLRLACGGEKGGAADSPFFYYYRPDGPTLPLSHLLASGSKDRLIHVFSLESVSSGPPLGLVHTLEDHTAAVTGGALLPSASPPSTLSSLVSVSQDQSLLFRHIDVSCDPPNIDTYHRGVSGYGSIRSCALSPNGQFLVAVGADKFISIYSISTGLLTRSYRIGGSGGMTARDRAVSPLVAAVSPGNVFLAVACSDNSIRLLDFLSGDKICKLSGHSDVVQAMAFTPDSTRLLTASQDSTILIWKLGQSLVSQLQSKAPPPRPLAMLQTASTPTAATQGSKHESPLFKFRQSILPAWARVDHAAGESGALSGRSRPVSARGKWGREGGVVVSFQGVINDEDQSLSQLATSLRPHSPPNTPPPVAAAEGGGEGSVNSEELEQLPGLIRSVSPSLARKHPDADQVLAGIDSHPPQPHVDTGHGGDGDVESGGGGGDGEVKKSTHVRLSRADRFRVSHSVAAATIHALLGDEEEDEDEEEEETAKEESTPAEGSAVEGGAVAAEESAEPVLRKPKDSRAVHLRESVSALFFMKQHGGGEPHAPIIRREPPARPAEADSAVVGGEEKSEVKTESLEEPASTTLSATERKKVATSTLEQLLGEAEQSYAADGPTHVGEADQVEPPQNTDDEDELDALFRRKKEEFHRDQNQVQAEYVGLVQHGPSEHHVVFPTEEEEAVVEEKTEGEEHKGKEREEAEKEEKEKVAFHALEASAESPSPAGENDVASAVVAAVALSASLPPAQAQGEGEKKGEEEREEGDEEREGGEEGKVQDEAATPPHLNTTSPAEKKSTPPLEPSSSAVFEFIEMTGVRTLGPDDDGDDGASEDNALYGLNAGIVAAPLPPPPAAVAAAGAVDPHQAERGRIASSLIATIGTAAETLEKAGPLMDHDVQSLLAVVQRLTRLLPPHLQPGYVTLPDSDSGETVMARMLEVYSDKLLALMAQKMAK